MMRLRERGEGRGKRGEGRGERRWQGPVRVGVGRLLPQIWVPPKHPRNNLPSFLPSFPRLPDPAVPLNLELGDAETKPERSPGRPWHSSTAPLGAPKSARRRETRGDGGGARGAAGGEGKSWGEAQAGCREAGSFVPPRAQRAGPGPREEKGAQGAPRSHLFAFPVQMSGARGAARCGALGPGWKDPPCPVPQVAPRIGDLGSGSSRTPIAASSPAPYLRPAARPAPGSAPRTGPRPGSASCVRPASRRPRAGPRPRPHARPHRFPPPRLPGGPRSAIRAPRSGIRDPRPPRPRQLFPSSSAAAAAGPLWPRPQPRPPHNTPSTDHAHWYIDTPLRPRPFPALAHSGPSPETSSAQVPPRPRPQPRPRPWSRPRPLRSRSPRLEGAREEPGPAQCVREKAPGTHAWASGLAGELFRGSTSLFPFACLLLLLTRGP